MWTQCTRARACVCRVRVAFLQYNENSFMRYEHIESRSVYLHLTRTAVCSTDRPGPFDPHTQPYSIQCAFTRMVLVFTPLFVTSVSPRNDSWGVFSCVCERLWCTDLAQPATACMYGMHAAHAL